MLLLMFDCFSVVVDLNRHIGFLLEDKESLNDELKMKFVTIMKMTTYLFTNIVLLIIRKAESKKRMNFETKVIQFSCMLIFNLFLFAEYVYCFSLLTSFPFYFQLITGVTYL